ncbi:MAG TPA: IS66 family insertion sequence element accessory protein TnpB [Oscillospiraceae bacterium]|nr:IS66 family insertion sequence element accessory protein TnpB [Oscillospiraceae bacterium]
MLRDYQIKGKVYLALGYTDLRKGIDGLCAIVQENYGREIKIHDLFLFCGRRTDRIKGLLWEGDGFLLLYKRLEKGRFQWPRTVNELSEISPEQYSFLMRGMQVISPKIPCRNLAPKIV